jgi:hypothetical protein
MPESERKQDDRPLVVLQCDECGDPHVGCRDTACALRARPYVVLDEMRHEKSTGSPPLWGIPVYRRENLPEGWPDAL